ncbi:uncharacterized protein [Choristoneura fumiferana]|uniref:uncharacterized protein n=1 Tax=Choristoneura fumiferana TaxID=7141 RepID=UPI003D15DDEC
MGKSSLIKILRILLCAAGITTVTSTCTFTPLTANYTLHCKGLISCLGEITSVSEDVADWNCQTSPLSEDYEGEYELKLEITNNDQSINASRFGNLNEFIDTIGSVSVKNDTMDIIDPFIYRLKWTPNIDLSQNKIKKLNLREFNMLKGMVFLNLSHNAIDTLEEIGDNSFIVSSLLILDLSHNLIKTVPKYYFKWKQRLQHLNLSFNSIEYIDDLAFEGPFELKSLFITNNKLTQIGPSVGSLHELRMDFNNLTSLDDIQIRRNSSLKRLTASNNNLRIIGSLLQYTPALTELDLSHNDIHTVLKSQFYSFADNLICLDLSYNNIWKVESATFEGKNITHLKINNNKLEGLLQSNNTFKDTESSDTTIFIDETDSSQSKNVSTVLQQPPQRLNNVGTLQRISQLLDSKLEHVETSIIENIKIAIQNEINIAIIKLKDDFMKKYHRRVLQKFNKN